MNKNNLTIEQLFTEIIKRFKNKEIYLMIDDRTAEGSLHLVKNGSSLPTISIKIGEVYCNVAQRFDEN